MPEKRSAPPAAARHAPVPFWRDIRVLAILSQLVVLVAVVAVGGYLLNNLVTAMDQKGFLPDLGFLGLTAGFEIAEKVIAYTPSDTYADALLVGLLNTLMVSLVGIVLATILGLLVGIARLSRNWLVSRLALGYVELFRNTPLLVQLFVLYFVVFLQMPPVRESLALPGALYLNQRGVYLPRPELTSSGGPWLLSVVAGARPGRRWPGGWPVAVRPPADPWPGCACWPCWRSSGSPCSAGSSSPVGRCPSRRPSSPSSTSRAGCASRPSSPP